MITPPSGDPRDILPFNLFVAEEEGVLPTRRGKINELIKILKDYGVNLNHCERVYACGESCGLDINSLTHQEWEYIKKAVET